MLKELFRRYRIWKYAKSQSGKILVEGTLLNAFYKSKTIFIHIPKTAGVSLIKAIYGNVTLEGHRSFYFNSVVLDIKSKEYFSFAFVRNPFDRLYSAYMFLRNGGMNNIDKLAFDNYLSDFIDFEDFVLNGLDNNLIFKITHFIPQHKFLCDRRGNILVDFIGKFENLEDDVAFLSKKLDMNIELDHYNSNSKKNYEKLYTAEMVDIVTKVYQKDLIIFKYKFNKC